ncbi:MAG TPA: hypothetical protein VF043_25785, partial [Ktedonobacteraceae bacterium]
MLCQKVYSDILPRFGVRITSREIVPTGQIFSLVSPYMEAPNIVPCCFRVFLATEVSDSGRCAG